jgi:hypothetical protein
MHCAYNEGVKKENSPKSSSVFKVFIKSSFLFLLVTRYLSYLGGGLKKKITFKNKLN